MDILNGITIAVLCCGVSEHTSEKFAPTGGYVENHQSYGVHIEKEGFGFKPGIEAMMFKDSFGQPSKLVAATLMYSLPLITNKTPEIAFGAALGHVDTSYYNGVYAAPVLELGIPPVFLQGSYQIETSRSDGVAAVQLKLRLPF